MSGPSSGVGGAGSTPWADTAAAAAASDASTSGAAAASPALSSERFAADAVLAGVAAGTATLANGSRGVAVKRVQLALAELGHDIGRAGADGDYGRGTTAGVAAFQRAARLPPTGTVDAATLLALDARIRAVDHPAAPRPDATRLDSPRFAGDAAFRAVAAGTATLARGARGAAVEKLQWTLIGLGHDHPRYGADGSFGGETEAALKAFQRSASLPETGRLDRATLEKLDDAVATKVAELRALSPAPEEKPLRFRVVADLARCRVYVLEKGTDRPVASYLTSPGTAEFPTRGDRFTLQGTPVLGWWRPPSSSWAAGLEPAPPGLDNPMGIAKLSFGRYAQYFHGIPKHEERDLGRPASHGCMRMSGANVLELHECYAGPGTDVLLVRDQAASDDLARRFAAAGVADRPIAAGREYTAAYLYGEMGFNERLERDGRVTVGGRGG